MKREFKSGANRNSDEGKLDYEGFISPVVEWAFAQYMHKHRLLEDGTLRDSDNWQNGIPVNELMKSGHRHWQDIRMKHRGFTPTDNGKEVGRLEALLGMKFNIDAMIYNEVKDKNDVDRNFVKEVYCPFSNDKDPLEILGELVGVPIKTKDVTPTNKNSLKQLKGVIEDTLLDPMLASLAQREIENCDHCIGLEGDDYDKCMMTCEAVLYGDE